MPERFDPLWRRFAQRGHGIAARRSGAVICVSRATAEDAERELGAPPERIVVAPHGPGQELPSLERAEPPTHFLYVGDAEPRKGLEALMAAHAGLEDPLPLVLAGEAAAAARGAGVRGESGPAPDRLAELHAGAAALVHPSLHEGFGLTLLEAMKAGTPVVAVRNPAVEEVCGEAALLVELHDLADAMARAATDPQLRARLSESGRLRAEAFSWLRSAELHEQAYELAARVRAR
jgi:glycosyltransferase involved in cell wall biosynthesis